MLRVEGEVFVSIHMINVRPQSFYRKVYCLVFLQHRLQLINVLVAIPRLMEACDMQKFQSNHSNGYVHNKFFILLFSSSLEYYRSSTGHKPQLTGLGNHGSYVNSYIVDERALVKTSPI